MKEFKGTPAPWTFEGGNNEYCEVNAKDTTIDLTRCERNTGRHVISREEMVANGFLVAAAPELLKALQELTSYVSNHKDLKGFIKFEHLLSSSEKAITKALGETPIQTP